MMTKNGLGCSLTVGALLSAALLSGCNDGQDSRITNLEKQNADLAMKVVNLQQEIYTLKNETGILDARTDSTLKKIEDVNEKYAGDYGNIVELQAWQSACQTQMENMVSGGITTNQFSDIEDQIAQLAKIVGQEAKTKTP